ncbi:hypothetical protein HORIV_50610 [Vreelandella olivaria]|uniref:TRAP transporter small permease protein n=1 Tax=Vreelandella olivaria TaxID=390919 RepID=A0ABN5X6B7_9GAMM|nr:hypothetical protein HORIV_50610 [Halomonas olivaria]
MSIMFFNLVDQLSKISAWLSKLALIILAGAMLYEVIARYVFNASTIWAFDISYMATGVAFMLGVAWTAQVDGHVKVDVLSSLMPVRISRIITGVAYTIVLFPPFHLLLGLAGRNRYQLSQPMRWKWSVYGRRKCGRFTPVLPSV